MRVNLLMLVTRILSIYLIGVTAAGYCFALAPFVIVNIF